jgi:hypothetical protein
MLKNPASLGYVTAKSIDKFTVMTFKESVQALFWAKFPLFCLP